MYIYIYIYIDIHARGRKFFDTSVFLVIGNVQNCGFTVVICTFLSIGICFGNLMFDGRCFFCFFRPFKLTDNM